MKLQNILGILIITVSSSLYSQTRFIGLEYNNFALDDKIEFDFTNNMNKNLSNGVGIFYGSYFNPFLKWNLSFGIANTSINERTIIFHPTKPESRDSFSSSSKSSPYFTIGADGRLIGSSFDKIQWFIGTQLIFNSNVQSTNLNTSIQYNLDKFLINLTYHPFQLAFRENANTGYFYPKSFNLKAAFRF